MYAVLRGLSRLAELFVEVTRIWRILPIWLTNRRNVPLIMPTGSP